VKASHEVSLTQTPAWRRDAIRVSVTYAKRSSLKTSHTKSLTTFRDDCKTALRLPVANTQKTLHTLHKCVLPRIIDLILARYLDDRWDTPGVAFNIAPYPIRYILRNQNHPNIFALASEVLERLSDGCVGGVATHHQVRRVSRACSVAYSSQKEASYGIFVPDDGNKPVSVLDGSQVASISHSWRLHGTATRASVLLQLQSARQRTCRA